VFALNSSPPQRLGIAGTHLLAGLGVFLDRSIWGQVPQQKGAYRNEARGFRVGGVGRDLH